MIKNACLRNIIACFLIVLSCSIEAASLYEVRIEVENLNVREYPTVRSEVIGTLDVGVTTVVSKSGVEDWYFLNLQDKAGYVSSEHVKLIRVIVLEDLAEDKRS